MKELMETNPSGGYDLHIPDIGNQSQVKEDFVTLFSTSDKLGIPPSAKIQVKNIDLND